MPDTSTLPQAAGAGGVKQPSAPVALINPDGTVGSFSDIAVRDYDDDAIVGLAIGAQSAQSASLPAGQYEISADVDCYVKIGANPVAARETSRFLAAGAPWTRKLAGKVAVIQASQSGRLTILRAV